MKFLDKEQRNQVGFSFVMDKMVITTSLDLMKEKILNHLKPRNR